MNRHALAVVVLFAVPAALPAYAADKLLVAPLAAKMPKPKIVAVEAALLEALQSGTSAQIVNWEEAKTTLLPKDANLGQKCKKAPCWAKLADKTASTWVLGVVATMVKMKPQLTLALVDASGAVVGESRQELTGLPDTYAAQLGQAVAGLGLPQAETVEPEPTPSPAEPVAAPVDSSSPVASSTPTIAAMPGWLGVRYSPVTSEVARRLGLEEALGAWVVKLHPTGPAWGGGVAKDDVVLSWNGETLVNDQALGQWLRNAKAGDEVQLDVWREGQRVSLTVTLAQKSPWP